MSDSHSARSIDPAKLTRVGDVVYEIPRTFRADMHVPVRLVCDEVLLASILRDRSVEQLLNVSTLPGMTRAALGMPDMHEGYGFPVGGVAATMLPDGVISPAGSVSTSTAACASSRRISPLPT